jgi:hypothetical protein
MNQKSSHPTPKPENGLAVAALVLGIISLTGAGALTGIPAIITGAMSLKNPYNKGLGVAGLVMGIVATVLTILFIGFLLLIVIIAASASPSPQPHQGTSPAYPSGLERRT